LYIHKVLFANKLALALVLVYMVGKIVLLPKHRQKALPPAPALGSSRMSINKPANLPGLAPEDYAEIIKRNLFGASDQATGSEWTPTADSFGSELSVSEELGLALFGTVSGNPAVARAVIKDLKTGTFDLYKMGQIIAGARIESIGPDVVILSHNGKRKILRFNTAPASGYNDNDADVPSARTTGGIEPVSTDLSTQKVNANTPVKIGYVETILKKAVIEPYVVDGQTEGLRITGLENIKQAKDLGLKNGDVIRVVNGHRLTSKQKAYQVFKKARSQTAMNMELLRGNRTKKLSFALQ